MLTSPPSAKVFKFLSTLSLRRATTRSKRIHALLAESDPRGIVLRNAGILFLSTLSLRRATTQDPQTYHQYQISIHALLAESDNFDTKTCPSVSYFYPRSPCGERPDGLFFLGRRKRFLSTLSLRRATGQRIGIRIDKTHFYPRSPCGERQEISESRYRRTFYFYPRSPCGERLKTPCVKLSIDVFLSTLSLRRATMC